MPDTAALYDLSRISRDDFDRRTGPHRRELMAHCYRMLGSVHDAEDMVQETLLRAWRGRATFEGRASLRAWLYRIATHVCLDELKKRPRRMVPVTRGPAADLADGIPPEVREPIWLEPYPDELLPEAGEGPEGATSTREHIALAFIAVLHLLPPRQRAILLLRDVLDWQAGEVADLLGISVPAVKSALHRARATLAGSELARRGRDATRSLDPAARQRLERYVCAWETADVDALIGLLEEDATFSMPPIPSWYRGRAEIGALVSKTIFAGPAAGRWRLLPTRANGQVAFGLYRVSETPGTYTGYGIQVLTFAGEQIADITTFREPGLITLFGLQEILTIPPVR